MSIDRLIAHLGSLLPAHAWSVAAADLTAHAGDKWFAAQEPRLVVWPENTAQVSAVMSAAHTHQVAVTPRGAGYGYVGGCVPLGGSLVLDLSRMNQILEINLPDGVAVVQPGVITGHLQQAVRAQGWFYPPDPASLKDCSLGGNIATNAGGPRCLKYGVTRHYVLGLEVVLADGRVTRVGGRCHKNKTGFDLVGLFVGSEGLLGIVTEATLRLIPHPETRAGLSASFTDFTTAAAAVQTVLQAGFLPSALEVCDRFTLEAARRYLGPDKLPAGESMLMLEIDGRAASVAHDLEALQQVLRQAGALHLTPAPDEAAMESLWQQRREFSFSLRATGLTKLNEDIVVPRGRLVDLVTFCEALQAETGIAIACFGHAGDGNIHVNLMVDQIDDPATRERAEAALDRLFHYVLSLGGAITGEHGIGLAKKKWFPTAIGPVAFDLHEKIKHALDPHGLLNPEKFLS
jgi:glycolate oxidase